MNILIPLFYWLSFNRYEIEKYINYCYNILPSKIKVGNIK